MIDCIEQQQQNLQNPTLHLNQYHHQPHLTHHHQQQSPVQQISVGRPLNNNQMLAMYHQQIVANPPSLVELPISTASAASTTTATNNNNSTHQQTGNELIGYYFGSISRETAEWILKSHGNQTDGAYLLRSSGPNDDFVLSLMVVRNNQATINQQSLINNTSVAPASQTASLEVLHYKIVETEDSFVALHGQVGDEKFATIDELIDKAQGVATKPRWPINRLLLESQILPPTYWGLTVDQIRLAILLKAKQWGFPLLSSLFQQAPQQEQLIQNNVLLSIQHQHQQPQQQISLCNQTGNMITEKSQINNNITTLNNETIRTLIYKSLHEFQPWFHGKISREEAERRIEEGSLRDGRFLVRERDNYSYAMCISHKKTTKHYRIDVLPTGELAIQDGRKFTSLMALVSHYTIMSDGLWCALTEACPRPIQKTNCIQRNLNNGCSGTALNNTLPSSNAQISRNNCNIAMNQNVYCIPPPCNNISNNAITSNMHNLPSHMPTIKSFPDNNSNSCNKNDLQLSQNNPTGTHSNGKTPTQTHNLICTPQQAGIVSIKAPIKEWLQTINHKWSQLIASKNQHQSLNSFLFGNQNPLNNHCRHSHRNQHHMSHRRKCKNGHTSCGCIQQIIANGRAPSVAIASALSQGVNSSGIANDSIGTQQFAASLRIHDISRVQRCCTSTHCQVANKDRLNSLIPRNIPTNGVLTDSDPTNNALLSCLPKNSGFTLNSQSFIGSPLFAVKQHAQLERNHTGNYSGSSSSGSGSGKSNNVGEEKLISPAQSISGDLNNPYNLNNDIYGSQTSTAVVNDRIQTSSSSSSGTVNMLQRSPNNTTRFNVLQKRAIGTIKPMISQGEVEKNRNVAAHRTQIPKQVGPILCGQHAGPAYRYTNCNDENSFKPCYHRSMASDLRAADDSLLLTPSTQLANSTAMAKFVQFQDGQCLRTHRDTRSIQMAYLSSRQDISNTMNADNAANFRSTGRNNQVPLRELKAFQQQQQQNNVSANLGYILKNDKVNHHNGQNNIVHTPNNTPSSAIQTSGLLQTGSSSQQFHSKTNPMSRNVHENSFKDVDLMDCGEYDDDYAFKYDPKLIKSSSIETLCGVADDDQIDNELVKCNNNTELMMSLQSCWFANQQPEVNLLNPIPSNQYAQSDNGFTKSENQTGIQQEQTSMLSNLMTESGQEYKELIHMKKKHDLDELTTALLAELTASLKAQVDLKNKRSGFGLHNAEKQQSDQLNQNLQNSESGEVGESRDPLELIHEFDTLVSNNR